MPIDKKDTFLRKLGERIRNLRLEKGLRQEDFDDETELGITSRGFQQIEYGRNNVKVYTLAMIAERLGVTLPQLLDFGSDDGKGRKRVKRS
jgi:transcriptional regulator with XRE-family HTH domain